MPPEIFELNPNKQKGKPIPVKKPIPDKIGSWDLEEQSAARRERLEMEKRIPIERDKTAAAFRKHDKNLRLVFQFHNVKFNTKFYLCKAFGRNYSVLSSRSF